jgi:DNA-binding response OmpR family regulator
VVGRILLVEPDDVLSAVLKEVLGHRGYEVIIVRTLKGEVVHIHSVSAVILDVDTMAADRELARLSLLQLSHESLPIILMSVKKPEEPHQRPSLDAVRLQTKQLVWVRKPFLNEDLLAAIRKAQESPLLGQVNGI